MLLTQVKSMSLSKRKLKTKSSLFKLWSCNESSTQFFPSECTTTTSEFQLNSQSERTVSKLDPASPPAGTSNKSVSFDQVETFEIEKVNKRMKDKLWYNEIELQSLKKENCRLIVQAMKNGLKSVDSQPNQTIRGLEFSIANDVLTKKRHEFQVRSRKAVLNEQLLQKKLGTSDARLIRNIYRAFGAKTCQDVARNLGLHDEGVAIDTKEDLTSAEEEKNNMITNLLPQMKLRQQKQEQHERVVSQAVARTNQTIRKACSCAA